MKNSSIPTKIEVSGLKSIQLQLPAKINPEPKTTWLSILDAKAAKFRCTSVIWFYPSAAASPNGVNALSSEQLRLSLIKTLIAYPWFTGRLDWAHSPDSPFGVTTHEKRFRRLAISYGSPDTNLGALFVAAACESHSLSDLIPSPDKRGAQWDPPSTGWTSEQFLPDLPSLALYQFPKTEGPCLGVQVTTFKCGGIAIGIAVPHQIADALTVTNFMRDWSNVNTAMVKGEVIPELSPCFLPSLLDAKATGNIDALRPDSSTISRARNLPMLRHDHWVDKAGNTIVERLPSELQNNQDLLPPHDVAIEWETWDMNAPVSYRVFHFGPEEIERMYKAALSSTLDGSINGVSKQSTITRHDALLAHLWQCVNAARKPLLQSVPHSDVFLTLTLGLRARLGLPSSFVGSSILIAYVSKPAGDFFTSAISDDIDRDAKATTSLAQIASEINKTQSLFTASAIGDVLHDAAFEICPHRLWQSMLGSRHTLTTSWIHTHTYDDMDFGAGVVPWYVHPGVFKPDGQVIIMEARPVEDAKSADKWYHRGVDVGISLKEDTMERMLKDDLLRRWKS